MKKPAAAPSTPIVQPDSHKPIDYKKWDDIPTSDEEDEELQPTHQDQSDIARVRTTLMACRETCALADLP